MLPPSLHHQFKSPACFGRISKTAGTKVSDYDLWSMIAFLPVHMSMRIYFESEFFEWFFQKYLLYEQDYPSENYNEIVPLGLKLLQLLFNLTQFHRNSLSSLLKREETRKAMQSTLPTDIVSLTNMQSIQSFTNRNPSHPISLFFSEFLWIFIAPNNNSSSMLVWLS